MSPLALTAAILMCLSASAVDAKGDVSISLSARWGGTPYIAESAEALVR